MKPFGTSSTSARQSGASLLVALVLLLLLTLLALTSLRGVTLESRIMGNLKLERNLQSAAETALRVGEGTLTKAVAAPELSSTCSTSFCVPYLLRNNAYVNAGNTALGSVTVNGKSYPVGYVIPLFRSASDPSATLADYRILNSGSTTEAPNARWYVVDLGPLETGSENNCALTGCGTRYYEVNSCAGVGCASDETGQRITLRSVMAKNF